MPIDYPFEDDSKDPKVYQIRMLLDNKTDVECYYLQGIFANKNMDEVKPKDLREIAYKFVWTPDKKGALALSADTANGIATDMQASNSKTKTKTFSVVHE